MFGRLELDDGQVAEQEPVSGGWPGIVNRPFDIEPVDGNAGPDKRHRSTLAVVVRHRRQRRGVEAQRLLEIQPRHEFMHLRVE